MGSDLYILEYIGLIALKLYPMDYFNPYNSLDMIFQIKYLNNKLNKSQYIDSLIIAYKVVWSPKLSRMMQSNCYMIHILYKYLS